MTWLPDAFDAAAKANGSRTALVEEDRKWTFGELAEESDNIAAMLREKVAGDTVGILLLNSQKYVTTLLGVWKAGKTAVPLNYLLPPQELAFIIKDSGMSALISSQFFAQAVAAVKPLFGDQGVILMADDPDFAPRTRKGRLGALSRSRSLSLHVGNDRKTQGRGSDPPESGSQRRQLPARRRIRSSRQFPLPASVLPHLRHHRNDSPAAC